MAQNDEFGYHEVVDRSFNLLDQWSSIVASHEAVLENKEMEIEAVKVGNAMHEFYQKFSALRCKKFPS